MTFRIYFTLHRLNSSRLPLLVDELKRPLYTLKFDVLLMGEAERVFMPSFTKQ